MKNLKTKNKRVLKNGAIGAYVYYSKEKKWKWRIIGHSKKRGGENNNTQRTYNVIFTTEPFHTADFLSYDNFKFIKTTYNEEYKSDEFLMTIIQDNVKKMHDIRKHDGLNGHISSSSHNHGNRRGYNMHSYGNITINKDDISHEIGYGSLNNIKNLTQIRNEINKPNKKNRPNKQNFYKRHNGKSISIGQFIKQTYPDFKKNNSLIIIYKVDFTRDNKNNRRNRIRNIMSRKSNIGKKITNGRITFSPSKRNQNKIN